MSLFIFLLYIKFTAIILDFMQKVPNFYRLIIPLLFLNMINILFGRGYVFSAGHLFKSYFYTLIWAVLLIIIFAGISRLMKNNFVFIMLGFFISFALLFFEFLYRFHVLKNPKHSLYSINGLFSLFLAVFTALMISLAIFFIIREKHIFTILIAVILIPAGYYLLMPGFKNNELKDQKPNIILISMDTYRHDALGIYSQEHAGCLLTRYIGRKNSIVFTNHYTDSPQTNPSHATIFTSLQSTEHRVYTNAYPLDNSFITLAEILRNHSYSTYAFISGLTMNSNISGLNQGFMLYNEQYSSSDRGFYPWRLFSFFKYFIKRIASDTNNAVLSNTFLLDNKPFFLFLHYFDPHTPYEPRHFEKPPYYRDKQDRDSILELYKDPQKGRYMKGWIPDGAGIEYVKELYYAETRELHTGLTYLLNTLEKKGLLENTIIVITADHGESLDEHGIYFDHVESPYNTALRIPLIIIQDPLKDGYPVSAGKITSHIDIMPTILNLCGIRDIPDNIAGISLLSTKAIPRDRIHIFHLFGKRHISNLRTGIVSERYKVITDHSGVEIYDLKEDPMEIRDLSEKGEGEHSLQALLEKAAWVYAHAEGSIKDGRDEILNPKLKSLGYIQ